MGPLAHQPRGDRVLGVGGDVEFGTELGARAAGAAFAHHGERGVHGRGDRLHQRLKAHGICQARLQRGHVHDPGQRVVALLGRVKAHLAVLVGVRLHLQHGRRMLRVGPAAHGFQQRARGGVARIGAHVAVGGGALRRAHQRHAQAVARQQECQGAAHHARAADTYVKCLRHPGIVGAALRPCAGWGGGTIAGQSPHPSPATGAAA